MRLEFGFTQLKLSSGINNVRLTWVRSATSFSIKLFQNLWQGWLVALTFEEAQFGVNVEIGTVQERTEVLNFGANIFFDNA